MKWLAALHFLRPLCRATSRCSLASRRTMSSALLHAWTCLRAEMLHSTLPKCYSRGQVARSFCSASSRQQQKTVANLQQSGLSRALYVVGTPIGNLEDITLRAVRVLREASVIMAEDTRHTRKLLTHLNISNNLLSLHTHNEASRAQEVSSVTLPLGVSGSLPALPPDKPRVSAARCWRGLTRARL